MSSPSHSRDGSGAQYAAQEYPLFCCDGTFGTAQLQHDGYAQYVPAHLPVWTKKHTLDLLKAHADAKDYRGNRDEAQKWLGFLNTTEWHVAAALSRLPKAILGIHLPANLESVDRAAPADCELVRRMPAQLNSASESEWLDGVTLRVHKLTLLTRREKEVLQRRPALLQLVREYCLEVTAVEDPDGNSRPFEQKERYRAEAIANEPHRLAGLQRDRERLARLRALRAEREATVALLSQALESKDEIMSPAADSSGVTPLCNSLAS